MKVFVIGLGNNQSRKELPPGEATDYNFIKDLEDKVLNLVRKVRSDKLGEQPVILVCS